MVKRKEVKFTPEQMTQLHEVVKWQLNFTPEQMTQLHEVVKWQLNLAQARLDNAEVKVPKFENIENYTDDELQAAINKAIDSEGAIQFWRLMNAFDAFIEKRRRKRGWGLSYTENNR